MHSLEETRREMREAWGLELEDVFEEFDAVPVASGSVAQLHRARLKEQYAMEDGERNVAVKVGHILFLSQRGA